MVLAIECRRYTLIAIWYLKMFEIQLKTSMQTNDFRFDVENREQSVPKQIHMFRNENRFYRFFTSFIILTSTTLLAN